MNRLTRTWLRISVEIGQDARREKANQLGKRVGQAGELSPTDSRELANLGAAFPTFLKAAIGSSGDTGSPVPSESIAVAIIPGRSELRLIARAVLAGVQVCFATTVLFDFLGLL
jgi:hypothetical protein